MKKSAAFEVWPYQRRWVEDEARLKIAVKARQIGFSFAATLRAVRECLKRRTTWVFLSKGERQALLLMEKVKAHLQAMGAVANFEDSTFFEGTSAKQLEARFANGSVIYGLPANPETARGYSGNVTLDEFAFHTDADRIYAALFPTITRGYSLEIISTPNGRQGKFFELADAAGLTEQGLGIRVQELGPGKWSGHWCDVEKAIREGLAKQLRIPKEEFLGTLRGGLDEETWRQEFCCEFVSTATQWIAPELWQACVSSEASVEMDSRWRGKDEGNAGIPRYARNDNARTARLEGEVYAGWDVARNRDLSVIWLIERVGDVSWTRGVIEMANTPTPEQIERARGLLIANRSAGEMAAVRKGGDGAGRIRRMAIDRSGMGLAIYEQLAEEFPGRVEGVQFTQATKEAMAVRVRERMEKGLLRTPDSPKVREAFMRLRRVTTATGLARFDAEHDARFGHADHFWACALAEAAAESAAEARSSWREGFLADGEMLINRRVFVAREVGMVN